MQFDEVLRNAKMEREHLAAIEESRHILSLATESLADWLLRMPKNAVRPWGINSDQDQPFEL